MNYPSTCPACKGRKPNYCCCCGVRLDYGHEPLCRQCTIYARLHRDVSHALKEFRTLAMEGAR